MCVFFLVLCSAFFCCFPQSRLPSLCARLRTLLYRGLFHVAHVSHRTHVVAHVDSLAVSIIARTHALRTEVWAWTWTWTLGLGLLDLDLGFGGLPPNPLQQRREGEKKREKEREGRKEGELHFSVGLFDFFFPLRFFARCLFLGFVGLCLHRMPVSVFGKGPFRICSSHCARWASPIALPPSPQMCVLPTNILCIV